MTEVHLNKVVLIGRLTKDPDLRHTNNGTPICNLRVKMVEVYQRYDGEMGESACSLGVVLWGKKGEDIAGRCKEGALVYVAGKITNRSYEDRMGQTQWITEVNASIVSPLEETVSDHGTQQPQQPAPQQKPTEPKVGYGRKPPPAQKPIVPEDDLPF